MAKKNNTSNGVKAAFFIGLGLFVILFSMVLSNPKYRSFKDSDAAALKKVQNQQNVINFWPNSNSMIPNTNIAGFGSYIQMNGNQSTSNIEFTQTTSNNDVYAAYGTTFTPVIFKTNALKAAIYGWTEASCGVANAGFTLFPLQLVGGQYQTFGGQIGFGTLTEMEQAGNCYLDPAHLNGSWNAFRAQVTYTGGLNNQSVSAAAVRFFNADANTPPGKKFEIAKLTLCDNLDQSTCTFEEWPPLPPQGSCGSGCSEQKSELCNSGLICDYRGGLLSAGVCVIPECDDNPNCTCTAP